MLNVIDGDTVYALGLLGYTPEKLLSGRRWQSARRASEHRRQFHECVECQHETPGLRLAFRRSVLRGRV
jgi:hypothetical protein